MAELAGDDLYNVQQAQSLVAAAARFRREGPAGSRPGGYSSSGTFMPSFDEALRALDDALGATIQHMKEQQDGRATSRTNEQIRDLWSNAGQKLWYHDAELSNACMMKGNGWVDAEVWKRAEAKNMKIGIADMENARMDLTGKRPSEAILPRWFPIAGVLFAAATVIFLMYSFIVGLPVDQSRRLVLNVLMAFCVAASAAFLTGTAAARGRIPLFKNSPIEFSAVGGVGVFVVVLLIMKYAV